VKLAGAEEKAAGAKLKSDAETEAAAPEVITAAEAKTTANSAEASRVADLLMNAAGPTGLSKWPLSAHNQSSS
jgi:hypothetical protein